MSISSSFTQSPGHDGPPQTYQWSLNFSLQPMNQWTRIYTIYISVSQNEPDTLIVMWPDHQWFNTWRPRQHGRHLPDDIFKCIFLNENVWTSIQISLKFVPKGPIDNIPALVQIMAWRRPGDKPLSEPMLIILLTHICVTRPQWVNTWRPRQNGLNTPDDTFKWIFLYGHFYLFHFYQNFTEKFGNNQGSNSQYELIQIMAWEWAV